MSKDKYDNEGYQPTEYIRKGYQPKPEIIKPNEPKLHITEYLNSVSRNT